MVGGLFAFAVIFLAEDEHDDIGVLFDRAGFAQVRKLRALVFAALDLAGSCDSAITGMSSSLATAFRPW